MLSCREVLDLVTEYLEGAMPGEGRMKFERHVAICTPCRGLLSQMRETIRLSGTLREETLAPETREALVDAFRDFHEHA